MNRGALGVKSPMDRLWVDTREPRAYPAARQSPCLPGSPWRWRGFVATALLLQSWIRASVSAYPSRSAIWREVSTIAFARIQARRRAGLLLDLLYVLWITIMSGGATRPWIRAASRPT